MRVIEFASAEEQLALWKLVNDSVWQALQQQQQQQIAAQQQAAAAPAKSVPQQSRAVPATKRVGVGHVQQAPKAAVRKQPRKAPQQPSVAVLPPQSPS